MIGLDDIFGKVEECWDCGKSFRAKNHHYKTPNGNTVPICNTCIFHRDINKVKQIKEAKE